MVSNVEVESSDRGGPARRGGVLSLEDCCCPVCLEIFMEPVTLPCTHTFCKACFLESVDKSTLCCPLCRKRVSTWARLNSRKNTLVNQPLWTQIQTSFPQQCQRRLGGQDGATDSPAALYVPRVSQPGEVRQEYEDQVTKLTEEKRVLEEEERRASEEYIQRLLAEEEEVLQEERRRGEDDERLAILLSNQLNSAASQENPPPPGVTPAKKKKKEVVGQMDRFLSPRPARSPSDGIFKANKENILVSPQAEHPPPPLDYYGEASHDPEPCSTSSSASVEDLPPPARDAGPSSAKRKSSVLEINCEEETKRVCHSSSSSPLEGRGSVLEDNAESEVELLRRKQEEEDRRVALLLQKELDQEERLKATDRRKGSSDAYSLRPNRGAKVEAAGSSTPNRDSRKTPKTTSAPSVKSPKTSSASSVKTTNTSSTPTSIRGRKQATLTEMFSSLIS